jgi:hypothetical protein
VREIACHFSSSFPYTSTLIYSFRILASSIALYFSTSAFLYASNNFYNSDLKVTCYFIIESFNIFISPLNLLCMVLN